MIIIGIQHTTVCIPRCDGRSVSMFHTGGCWAVLFFRSVTERPGEKRVGDDSKKMNRFE